ncbi:MAG: hypothetical protein NT084_02420 [Bacteroidetes bacterium]|nr:hypothetical protein [Bacteroidota bacterium]
MENQAPAQKEKSNAKLHAIYLTIIFLLAGLCGFMTLQYKSLKTIVSTKEIYIEQVVKAKEDVEGDLKELKDQYAQLQSSDVKLNAELEGKRAYIDSLLIQAEKHKGDSYIIAKLRKETNTLRAIMKGYIVTIDSLNQLNNKLIADKKQVLGQLDNEKAHSQQISDEKDKLKGRIDRAAVLSTLNVKSTGIKISRGGKKDTETNKASKVDKIRVTFDIGDNDLTIAGPHDIYIRIITPDAQELTQEKNAAHQFSFGGSTSYFCAKKTIDYQNQPMSVLVLCPKAKDEDTLAAGKYIIEIYSDGVMIGTTTLTLE